MIEDRNHSSFIPLSRRPVVNFQAATRRMGVWVRSIHLRYTPFTTRGVQLSGKVPFLFLNVWCRIYFLSTKGSPKVCPALTEQSVASLFSI